MTTMERETTRHNSGIWESLYVSEIAHHREARLATEREHLERRLSWAKRRKEAAKVKRLEDQLAALDDDMDLPREVLEGTGRATSLRREYGEEMAEALGW